MAMLPISLPMEDASSLMPNFPPKLCSPKTLPITYLMFVNKTGRSVNVYWVDFEGKLTFYYQLEPETVVRVNTFPNHLWVFRESNTGEIMQVNKKDLFSAVPNVRVDVNAAGNVNRTEVEIHYPLRSLEDKCIWIYAGFLKDTLKIKHPSRLNDRLKNCEQEVKSLELPNVISNDLTFYAKVRLRYDFFNQRTFPNTEDAPADNN